MSLQQASFDLNTEALAFINGKGTTDTNFLRISSESIIGDQYWDFFTSYINRPASISRAKLVVDWSSYHYIPLEIISELKTVFGLYYLVPEKVRTAKRIKPNSLISTIRSVCRFLDGYFGEISNELGLSNVSTKIADISISSLRKYTRSSNLRMGEVKKGLQIIGHPAFSEYIGKVQFNEYDVKTLSSKHNPVARRSLEESPFLPDDLFNLLSSQATAVVSEFLDGMGIDRMDKSLMQKAIIKPPTGVFRHIEAYIDYRLLARRDVDSRSASKASKGSRRTGSEGIEANAICSSIRRHMEVGLRGGPVI